MLKSIKKEIQLRKSYLKETAISSIYFGGGTPSILNKEEIESIIKTIYHHFTIDPNAEITLECNPDDLDKSMLTDLKEIGINRLSIGIQSFDDDDLQFMNRSHNAKEALDCIHFAKEAGFTNITIDLIYGLPSQSNEKWKQNLKQMLALDIQHFSAYALTIEPKTALKHLIDKKKVTPLEDKITVGHFNTLTQIATENNFIHYEISNFGKRNFYSKNNESYWLGESYIGIGPSAHSFDGKYRSWNISNNIKYINNIKLNKLPVRREKLSKNDKFNEYIMIGLRTIWGVSSKRVLNEFGKDYLSLIKEKSKKHIKSSNLFWDGEILRISNKAKFLTDGIASDLFII